MHRWAEDTASGKKTVRATLNWLLLHIQTTDQNLANWFQETGTEYEPSATELRAIPYAPRTR